MAKDGNLVYTPTWAIASTCAVFIMASLIAERTIYFIGHLLVKYKQIALQEAFERVKEELMMVGFISIALVLGQGTFSSICVPTKWSKVMRLCNNSTNVEQRLTLEIRGLAETGDTQESQTCKADHSPFMTAASIHQLHILIFILATVHVVYTVVIVALGMWTVGHWKVWEERANVKEQLSVHGGVRLTRETTFMRAHINEWESHRILSYVVAFFRQFHNIVNETDYHTLRNGFIKNHMPSNTEFNFHKYIRRSLQDDLKYTIVVQMLCGTITLPIYALVSQMGSSVKKTIFEEHIQKALRKWQEEARVRVRKARGKAAEGRARRPSPESLVKLGQEGGALRKDGESDRTVEMVLHNFPNLWTQGSREIGLSINV